jgi:hypothetical protein
MMLLLFVLFFFFSFWNRYTLGRKPCVTETPSNRKIHKVLGRSLEKAEIQKTPVQLHTPLPALVPKEKKKVRKRKKKVRKKKKKTQQKVRILGRHLFCAGFQSPNRSAEIP